MDDFEGGLMTKKKRREKAESDHTVRFSTAKFDKVHI